MNRRVVATIVLLTSMWVLYQAMALPWWSGEPSFDGARWSPSQLGDFVNVIALLVGVLRPFALVAGAVTVVTAWVPALARGRAAAASTAAISAILVVVPAFVIRATPAVGELGLQVGPAWGHVFVAAFAAFVASLTLRSAAA